MGKADVFDLARGSSAAPLRLSVVPGDPGSPVLYVLDSFFLFELAVGAASLLRAAARVTGGPFPALTMVGIGYPTDDPMEVFALRAHDLTPTDGRAGTGIDLPPLRFGGAEGFLSALVDEVIPTVEARYPVDPRSRAVAGFSFSGLFGLYVLFHRPEVFSSYLLGSPSLWWDDGLVFGWEEAWARGHDDLAARVFLSIGSNEVLVEGKNEVVVADTWKNENLPLETIRSLARYEMRDLAEALSKRAYPNLRLETAVFEGEYHLSAPGAAITLGLLFAFEDALDT